MEISLASRRVAVRHFTDALDSAYQLAVYSRSKEYTVQSELPKLQETAPGYAPQPPQPPLPARPISLVDQNCLSLDRGRACADDVICSTRTLAVQTWFPSTIEAGSLGSRSARSLADGITTGFGANLIGTRSATWTSIILRQRKTNRRVARHDLTDLSTWSALDSGQSTGKRKNS